MDTLSGHMERANGDVAPPRVLIITASVGNGHNAVAAAITARLKQVGPAIEIDCLYAVKMAPRSFRACYAGGFSLGMSQLTRAYGLGYRLTDRPQSPSRSPLERVRLAIERRALKDLMAYLLAHRPGLIVNTHFLAPPAVTWLNRTAGLGARQLVVVTDRQVHRFWFCEGVDHWFLPSQQSAAAFLRWGIPPEQVTVSGIPVHPKWTAPVDRGQVLSYWRLPLDKKIVLLTGGTEFTCGPIAAIARSIVSASPEAYVVVLAGRNKELLAQVCKLPEAPDRLTAIGFTDRLHELAGACSLIVTKPGGATTAECLAKGVPMVLLKPVPGQESGNARQLLEAGAAVIARSAKDVAPQVAGLLANQQRLAELAACAAGLHRPGCDTVAEAICRELQVLGRR